MKRLFVDTGAWLAVADRADEHHARATAFYRRWSARVRWVTSDYVLDELATRLRAIRDAEAAVRFVQTIRTSPRCLVMQVDEELFSAALRLMVKYGDHRLSMTDCTSFALMTSNGIQEAFGFDADYARCGFTLRP